jgi:hypothetical protein
MARFKDFDHGTNRVRHGEKVSHIRPFNWSHEVLGTQHCPKTSSGKPPIDISNERFGASDKSSQNLDPQMSRKTYLLNNMFSWLRSSCSHFL